MSDPVPVPVEQRYLMATGRVSPAELAWVQANVRRQLTAKPDLAPREAERFLSWIASAEDVAVHLSFAYDDVPLQALIPAFMLSELKTAFLIGFQIYLPFLILDVVVSSVTISMGMMMLPPSMISLPFKLLLFVLLDGWTLIVGMLLNSFVPSG